MFPEQNLPWWRHDRPWGFRFSSTDAAIFAGGAVATIALWNPGDPFALMVPYLLGHFFLFCNLFRLGGERDLIWIGAFLANAWSWTYTLTLVPHLVLQAAVTLGLILQCVIGRNYHGIGCTWINPANYRAGALSEGAFTRRVLLAWRVPKPLIEFLTGRRLNEFQTDP